MEIRLQGAAGPDTWKGQAKEGRPNPVGTVSHGRLWSREYGRVTTVAQRVTQKQEYFKAFPEGEAFPPRDMIITGILKS